MLKFEEFSRPAVRLSIGICISYNVTKIRFLAVNRYSTRDVVWNYSSGLIIYTSTAKLIIVSSS